MMYIVDRIEEDIVILEEYYTKEIIEIDKRLLSNELHEGSIIKKENNKYYLDDDDEIKRRNELIAKFMSLRKEEDDY